MTNILISIIENLKNILNRDAIVFIISLMPVLELRGGLIAASLLKISFIKAVLISVIGNILPIPFILLFLNKIFAFMEKWKPTAKFAEFFKNMAVKKKPEIDKYGFWGLVLFVGVPLPGTGAWTGSLVASVFHMDIKKASIAIFLGVLLALVIMSVISYGLIGNIVR